jgi:hypothetical protein
VRYDGDMERPQSIVGLAIHAVRLRWQALSPKGRMAAVAVGTFVTLAAATAGVHAASCGACCHGGCPSQMQAHSGCPHSHP